MSSPPPITSPMPPRGNRSAITIPMITNEMQAKLIDHFLWTSTAYRSTRPPASCRRSLAVATWAQLESRIRETVGLGGVGAAAAAEGGVVAPDFGRPIFGRPGFGRPGFDWRGP